MTGDRSPMRIVGVIPSRYASTRLPGKSLIPLLGKPLVQWVYERAAQATRLDRILVATDDQRIAEVVTGFGGEVVMTRADHPSGTDRIAEAVAGLSPDVVVNIQGDEPLISPDLIDQLAESLVADPSLDMATAASPIQSREELESPSIVKVVWGEGQTALYFSRSPIPHHRDSGGGWVPDLHWRHIGVYAYRGVFLQKIVQKPPCTLEKAEMLEQLRALDMGGRIKVLPTHEFSIGVDVEADIPMAEKMLRKIV